jgi:hypothetical protein
MSPGHDLNALFPFDGLEAAVENITVFMGRSRGLQREIMSLAHSVLMLGSATATDFWATLSGSGSSHASFLEVSIANARRDRGSRILTKRRLRKPSVTEELQ